MYVRHLMISATVATLAIAAPATAQTRENEFTGPYVAGTVGYDFQGNDVGERIAFDRNQDGVFGDTVVTAAGANAFSPGFCDGRAQGPTPNSLCENDRSRVGYYAKVGYDYQLGRIVVGIMGEGGHSDIEDYVSAFSTTPASYTFITKVDYDLSLRARVGVAADRTLFYGTGGLTYAKFKHSFRTTNTANSFTGRGDDDGYGYSAGGGVEQKITDKISLGVEYIYKQVKDDDYVVRAGPGTAPATNPFLLANATGTDFIRSGKYERWHSIRATAAFRF